VDKKNCDDYGYDKNNKVYDECGSLADAVTGLYQKMKSWFHNTAKGIKHLNAKLRDWSKENIQVIDIADLLENEKEILPKLAAAWDKFNDNQLKQLKAASKEVMDKIIAEIPPEDLAALSTSVQKNLDIAQRILTRLKAITLEDVANWGQYLWERIPINNLVTMSVRLPLGEVHWIYLAMIMALGGRLQVLMCSHLASVVSAIGLRAACRAILLAVLSQLCCHLRRHSLCPIDRWAVSTWACPGH